ncbi:MAG TPA: 4-hydroxythreonine-4-phosphate dehydrogenase PdxA [candidate division Zixibacteria bacterium]
MFKHQKRDKPLKPIIGITMGDPTGIGPEVVVKAVTNREIKSVCHPLVIGSDKVILSAAKRFLKKTNVRKQVWLEEVKKSTADINVLVSTSLDPSKLKVGKITPLSGKMAADSVFCAVQFALSGQIDAIVTAPLSKKGLHLAGYDFPGHTELLAYLTAAEKYAMMFVSTERRIVLATTHLPLSEVSKHLSKKLILEKLMVTHAAMQRYFGIKKPEIGVCALNPHGGEEGIFGNEERKHIIPAIKSAYLLGIRAHGPFPADTIYSPRIARYFDCILAMYHDQGLIPLKMKGLGHAVNLTIGLPIIRTSPDFGTALDIAGKGVADPQGMINAILLAVKLTGKTRSQI